MNNVHFDILIDGALYEGSSDLETALYLYNTIEETCLREYHGHTKSLQVAEGEKRITLQKGSINIITK